MSIPVSLASGSENSLADALDVFNEFAEGGGAGLITFNIMIDGFARKGQLVNVESLVAQLKRQGLLPNEYTFHALQRAAAVAQSPAHALEYFNMMCNAGVQANIGGARGTRLTRQPQPLSHIAVCYA